MVRQAGFLLWKCLLFALICFVMAGAVKIARRTAYEVLAEKRCVDISQREVLILNTSQHKEDGRLMLEQIPVMFAGVFDLPSIRIGECASGYDDGCAVVSVGW